MATGSINLLGAVSGGPDGARTFGPLVITTSSAVIAETSVALVVGSVTVPVPPGATAVVLFPPNAATPIPNPAYGGTITLKGVVADTGVPVSAKWPQVIAWDLPTLPASFVLTATAAGTLVAWFV